MSDLVRDIPMGRDGTKGRLLWIAGDQRHAYRFVFYRGTTARAKLKVAGAEADALRDLLDADQEMERRTGASSDLLHALARALDLPAADPAVKQVYAYLEGTA